MYANKLKWLFATLFILFTQLTSAQQNMNDYQAQWKKVEELEKKGLTKSAREEVLTIYTLAVKDNAEVQQVKACLYLIKYRNMVEEDSRENNIFYVDTLIDKAKAPVKQVLQSLHAQMFWQYLQNNRWKLYNRTALTAEKSKDITTWSAERLHQNITRLYKASLQGDALLKATRIDGFNPILIQGVNTRLLRPTLYDFLAHRALDYFDNDERDISKPAYAFTISDDKAFAPAGSFVNAVFKTKDTSSLQYKAIGLLQDIIRFHLNDASPDALIDADLIRLRFMYSRSVMTDKGKWYEAALEAIETRYPNNAAAAQATYLRAALYNDRGQDYDPLSNTPNQYEIKRAADLCNTIIKKFPDSEGGANCQNLLAQISRPSLNLQTEKVNTVNQPFRSLVSYKNTGKIYLRIIKTSAEDIRRMNKKTYESLWADLGRAKPLRQWSVNLPDLQDMQQHSTEIKVDGLPNGMYLLIGSLNEDFAPGKNILSKQLCYISNVSFINSGEDYYVLDRDNGQPLAEADVQVWENKYNYNTSTYDNSKAEAYTTDASGYFKMKSFKDYRNIVLQINHNGDELFLDDQLNTYSNEPVQEPQPRPVTFLFTDRSIYRPGQTVYFKGIVVQTDQRKRNSTIVPGFATKVQLNDANYQKVTDIAVTTNAFGSFNGSFKIPEGLLNGQFTLVDMTNQNNHTISVEEYKRPKFMVEIAKPGGSYRLNDSIKVTGTAKAYAGNTIDGAKVKYRITRQVRYPVWWEYYSYARKGGRYQPGRGSAGMEIGSGEATTNAKGEFTVTFKAIPDLDIPKKDQPTFYYEVSADVTDINGETRSANTSVAVAYQALLLDISMEGSLPADSLKKILVRSTNLNGIEEKAKIILSMEKLNAPQRFFRERYWTQPDQFVMSRDEYYKHFPYDIYKNENEVAQFTTDAKTWEKTDSSNTATTVPPMGAGWYKLTATTTDKYGEAVKAIKFVQLTSSADPVYEPIRVQSATTVAEPGQRIQYFLSSGFAKLWLIHQQRFMNTTKKVSYETLQGSVKSFELPVTAADRGGIAMGYAFVQHNRTYTGNQLFSVPWSNKELKISFNTFRDKLLPGASEQWSVKVSGQKGEKVAAEILAAMYDASLDQFKPHSWNGIPGLWPSLNGYDYWSEPGFNAIQSEEKDGIISKTISYEKSYDQLGIRKSNTEIEPLWWLNPYEYERRDIRLRGAASMPMAAPMQDAGLAEVVVTAAGKSANKEAAKQLSGKVAGINLKDKKEDDDNGDTNNAPGGSKHGNDPVQVRKNFNETAFFFPNLQTDTAGNVSFSFTMPEALTQWKLMTFAHTKDLATGSAGKTVITQKELMVQPNNPRFMREGDRMELSTKIVNLGSREVTGQATLELSDAATGKPLDGWFKNIFPAQYFTIPAGQSVAVKFPIEIPINFGSALSCRIIAKTTNASDGEESALPVLTNRTLVTESLPLNLRQTNNKTFTFDKLLRSGTPVKGNDISLSHQALTVEFTSNPAWYAVQALPYLMEYPYECAEQTFNRYYANTLAGQITRSMPKIRKVFDQWKMVDSAALLSNLQKNEELKSAILQETPWVMDAQNEAQQKKNIALLFDLVRMNGEMSKAIGKLKELQSANGGFVWFKGGPDDRYMTQYIITGIGHLRKLNALDKDGYDAVRAMVDRAIPYLDQKIREDYNDLLKYKVKLSGNNLGYTAIQYLYMRSFFPEYKTGSESVTAVNYYKGQAKKYWLSQSRYMQGMIALALHRDGDTVTPPAITRSLKENAIIKEEMGMYWKEFGNGGYYWYQSPIESQAMMVETFADIDKNMAVVDDLKTWLLKHKQTSNWKTTRATAEACYALLLAGNNWLKSEPAITIKLGNLTVSSNDKPAEAGTGYFKQRIEGNRVTPAMGNITVTRTYPGTPAPTAPETAWGSVYWQYFEDLDKITPAATPLKLIKQLFVETMGDRGPVLKAINDGDAVKVGDKIKVRIELRVDRDMEYIHMKDMRGACMEPVNVISTYKWQGGLGYYESTKDASTNFFFGWLPRGTYVFEYPLFVTHSGNFSNGITTIQCMYAPEFTSHSEGVRVSVE